MHPRMGDANTPESDNNLAKDTRGSSWTPVFVVVFLLLLGGVVLAINEFQEQPPSPQPNNETAATSSDDIPMGWRVYENRQYGFRMRYPDEGWTMTESPDGELGPRFSIHKTDKIAEPLAKPLDHFATGTYVGIYPHGIPTEAVRGQTTSTTDIDFSLSATGTRTYQLRNDDPWAVYTRFSDYPASWESHGFLWGRASINNKSVSCQSGGEAVSMSECEPMFGDTIVRNGTVDPQKWQTVHKILESFSFIPTNATTTTQ